MVAHAVTSLGNNLHNGVNIGDFSRFEDILHLYYQIHALLWIYHAYTQNDNQSTTYIFHRLIL